MKHEPPKKLRGLAAQPTPPEPLNGVEHARPARKLKEAPKRPAPDAPKRLYFARTIEHKLSVRASVKVRFPSYSTPTTSRKQRTRARLKQAAAKMKELGFGQIRAPSNASLREKLCNALRSPAAGALTLNQREALNVLLAMPHV